ncbi:MAG: class I SAM-dependent methyltransferase [Proteobacteria bacterium]|nr:class I SAM-dependent methyltransferase [Pseudomonadota bacterium]
MTASVDIPALRDAYRRGQNIMQAYRASTGSGDNSPEAIEIAYDLQAGQYIRNHASEPDYYHAYTDEQAALLDTHFPDCESLLDAGCGELTNTALLFGKLEGVPGLFGFDLSWSRVHVGLGHFRSVVDEDCARRTQVFVGEMSGIPLPDNSIDVVMTSHALEPNHGREAELLGELLRISRRGLLLFEPSYELGDEAQQKNMERHGYVRDLADHCHALGASVVAHHFTQVNYNPLNRTAVTVVRKPGSTLANAPAFVDPLSRTTLQYDPTDRVYHSPERGVVYPTLRGIPILRDSAAVLATGFEVPA